MRTQVKVPENTMRSIAATYMKGKGLVELAKLYGYGVAIIRRVLTLKEVAIRPKGRPKTA